MGLLSFHFGLLGLHFLLPSSGCPWGPPHKLPKTVRFAFVPYKEFSKARPGFIFQILAFWASIPHFGLLGLDFLPVWPFGRYFLSFWPFGPSFPFILPFWAFILAFSAFISFHFGLLGLHLPFWAFISFHFGLLGLHFLSFWPFGPSFPFIVACLGCCVRSPPEVSKMARFLNAPHKELNSARSGSILHFLIFWGFISFYFGLFGLYCFVFAFWGFFFYFVQNRLRTRADQSPSPWPTKPGENSAKPPTGRPRSKPMGHQTWRKLHAYGSSVEKAAKGQTKVQTHGPPNLEKIARLRQQCRRDRQRADQSPISISQLTCFKMKTVRCSARQCTPGRSHVLEGLTPKLNPKPVKVKMRVERQRGWETQKQSERAMKGVACQPTNSPPLSRDYAWTP